MLQDKCALCEAPLTPGEIDAGQYKRDFPLHHINDAVPACEVCVGLLKGEMPSDDLIRFVRESNWIEGLVGDPTLLEVTAHMRFLALPVVTVADLQLFVRCVQPGARLREREGCNVTVGDHVAPAGGPHIRTVLEKLLEAELSPAHRHWHYLTLHPFTDGNGRSSRVMWLREWGGVEKLSTSFLHHWYYQSLSELRPFEPYERR